MRIGARFLSTLVVILLVGSNAEAGSNTIDPVAGYDCAESMTTSDCFSYDDAQPAGSYGDKVKTCTKTVCWFCDWDPARSRSLCAQTKSEAKCYCNDDGRNCEKVGGTQGWCKIS